MNTYASMITSETKSYSGRWRGWRQAAIGEAGMKLDS
jgi:hypothetical protein